jgi:hypothetical protein
MQSRHNESLKENNLLFFASSQVGTPSLLSLIMHHNHVMQKSITSEDKKLLNKITFYSMVEAMCYVSIDPPHKKLSVFLAFKISFTIEFI